MSPRSKYQVIPIDQTPKRDVTHIGNRPLILIVDDERVIADTLSAILFQSGFQTMTAYNAEAALELARSTPPDLLISDVVMPGMSGINLAITITEVLPRCKVLLFSGQAATVDLLETARRSGHDFTTLTKPIHPTDMLRRIHECFEVSDDIFHSANQAGAHMDSVAP
jgi:DNA-binding NtrC family response regulator